MVAALLMVWLAMPVPATEQATPDRPRASLRDVEFMSGHWLGPDAGDLSEEVWTPPSGNSMLGMWRYVSGGQVRIAELLSMTEEPDGVVLRLRHFDPKLVAREEKDRPLALKLVRWSAGEARFEGPAVTATGDVALTYRQTGPNTLEASLERGGKTQTFVFNRRKAAN